MLNQTGSIPTVATTGMTTEVVSTAIMPDGPNLLAEMISASYPCKPEKFIVEIRKAVHSRIIAEAL
ncbi:hypothetical protein [Sulfitobacter sp.]|uniref:hypothetical protein n=1 Tax=Sulfitobacter sp. TaxID=1903071 RepID=UPI0030027CCE